MREPEKYRPTERFSGLADIYAKFRPGYSEEALTFIVKHCSLKAGDKLADIGCGTGISTRAMAKMGLAVTGVEPNKDMLEAAKRESSSETVTVPIVYLQAQAENTGLIDDTFNCILCAQAFHWFNPQQALLEFRRILKPGGWLALMWNERDESDNFTACYGNLIRTVPGASSVELSRGTAGEPLLTSNLYQNASKNDFKNEQKIDLEGLLGRAFSASYVPRPDSAEGKALELSLKLLFQEHEQSGTVILRYETSIYSAQKPL